MESYKKIVKRIYNNFKSLDQKKRSYMIAVVVIVIIMFWAFLSASVITGSFNRTLLKGKENSQKVDAKGIIITETKGGKKHFEIYGEVGNYSNDHSVATLYNVIGNFYKGDDVSMSFQSSKGTYDEKTGVITLFDNTYIVLHNGVSLKADKLIWQGNNSDTIVEGHVEINKNGEMMSTAEKGIIGVDSQKFKIIGKTQTKVYGKKGK